MIKIYSTSWCHPCKMAKKLLDQKKLKYEEINIEEVGISRQELHNLTGGNTVPQIMINGKSIGGFNDLLILNTNGKLDKLVSKK